jgi:predicted NBD/HSP70 family sugar kinase
LKQYPGHPLHGVDVASAATKVRGLADGGDAMSREIFRVQARALGLFFDQMVNLFDPDGFLIGGGALEASPAFRDWFVAEVRAGMPVQREEQAARIEHMPDGDTAGARGAALEAVRVFEV